MQIDNEVEVEARQHLINNEKFQLLKQCQKEIFSETESSPSIRKILNELITEENLNLIRSKFISVWKN